MTRKPRIMHIVFSFRTGGLENLVLNLIKKLDSSKYDFSVCSLSDGDAMVSELSKLGIPYHSFNKKGGVDYLLHLKLAGLLYQERIDIVHTHNSAPFFYGTIAAKLASVPIVIHTEHSKYLSTGRGVSIASRLLSNGIDTIVADCKDVANDLDKRRHFRNTKTRIILNGIDVDKFNKFGKREETLAELGITGKNEQIIGTVARLAPVKDHITLIDAFAIVNKILPNTRLIIVGDGETKDILKNRVAYLSLAAKVDLVGMRTDIDKILGVFDVFTLSSISEGLSLTLIEAMAASKPVVATNVGGNPEIVLNDITGFLVPPKNPQKMAYALLKILSDKELTKRMGEAGRKRVEEKFSLEKMAKKYEDLYIGCLMRKRLNIL